MNRQLIIGSLIGIALGGVLTSSIANGVFAGPDATASVSTGSETAEPVLDASDDGALPTFDGAPPLRPGSDRVGVPATPAPTPEIPVALDAHSTQDSPTV